MSERAEVLYEACKQYQPQFAKNMIDGAFAELEASNAKLREALRNYGWHDADCEATKIYHGLPETAGPCGCGFDQALASTENPPNPETK